MNIEGNRSQKERIVVCGAAAGTPLRKAYGLRVLFDRSCDDGTTSGIQVVD